MRRTGVIVGIDQALTAGQVGEFAEQLKERFPGVTFAVLSGGASSVAFEYDDQTPPMPVRMVSGCIDVGGDL